MVTVTTIPLTSTGIATTTESKMGSLIPTNQVISPFKVGRTKRYFWSSVSYSKMKTAQMKTNSVSINGVHVLTHLRPTLG